MTKEELIAELRRLYEQQATINRAIMKHERELRRIEPYYRTISEDGEAILLATGKAG